MSSELENRVPTKKQAIKAIKALDRAHEALKPFVFSGRPDDAVLLLRRQMAELASWMERANWREK